ncbi:MAG: FG-GAP repeat protein [Anaerolineales bacterium]|nr:FG-GAP repeat protein [Anaerolineales bacterium]
MDATTVAETEASPEGEDLTGADTTDDPSQFEGHEPPEFAAGSVTTQVEITEDGETPVAIAAASLLFMPAVTGNDAAIAQVESLEAASADGTSSITGSPTLLGDFNGDGRDDLVVGVPYEDTGLANVGFVHVIYGGGAGLSAAGNQFWSQDSAGIADISEANDYFGWSLAVGDFNGDNRDDLAIGAPYEDILAS